MLTGGVIPLPGQRVDHPSPRSTGGSSLSQVNWVDHPSPRLTGGSSLSAGQRVDHPSPRLTGDHPSTRVKRGGTQFPLLPQGSKLGVGIHSLPPPRVETRGLGIRFPLLHQGVQNREWGFNSPFFHQGVQTGWGLGGNFQFCRSFSLFDTHKRGFEKPRGRFPAR